MVDRHAAAERQACLPATIVHRLARCLLLARCCVSSLQAVLALGVVLVTLGVVLARPRAVDEGLVALAGGCGMVLLRAVGPGEALGLLVGSWNVLLFFLGLMVLAALAEQAQFFEWAAALAVAGAGGSPRRLLLNVFAVGAVITALLSNDATVLVLTPAVYTLAVRLGRDPRPFAFACTFVADTASFLLPVSNPVNVLVLHAFPAPLGAFLRHLLPAALASIAINAATFLWLFRAQVRGALPDDSLPHPGEYLRRPLLRLALAALALVAVGYLVVSAYQGPVSLVAVAGAALLAAACARHGALCWRTVARKVSWSVLAFVAGMLLVVRGVENTGVSALLARAVERLGLANPLLAVLATTFACALGANLINNLPMTLMAVSALGQAQPATASRLAYAAIIGNDLGPNLTTMGSLATILWLFILRKRGLEVTSFQYLKVGALVTPPVLLAAALLAWLAG